MEGARDELEQEAEFLKKWYGPDFEKRIEENLRDVLDAMKVQHSVPVHQWKLSLREAELMIAVTEAAIDRCSGTPQSLVLRRWS